MTDRWQLNLISWTLGRTAELAVIIACMKYLSS